MSLESCMIVLDCSEYMRNGDYIPTRLGAQLDAANLLISAKTQFHAESTVGVSAGTELLVSPRTKQHMATILSSMQGLSLKEPSSQWSGDVTAAIQVASLALKHRPNKNGSQRIILFVGSPLANIESRALQKAGRTLKKNNVAIDVVALGELADNEDKLRELVDAANGRSATGHAEDERTCHLVTIPAGVLPSDVLASSPILAGAGGYGDMAISAGGAGGGAGAGAGGAGFDGSAFAEFGGIDPNMDPELAMALRVSMEEERARQERVAAAAAAAAAADSSESKDAEMTDASGTNNAGGATAEDMGLSEEEALLQQALAMSMNENEPIASTNTGANTTDDRKPAATTTTTHDVDMQEDDDDDAAMQMALQMSMQTEEDSSKPSANTSRSTAAAAGGGGQFQDAAFVNELLGSMPGVDPNDPEIQQALRQAGGQDDTKQKDEGAKKDQNDPDKK